MFSPPRRSRRRRRTGTCRRRRPSACRARGIELCAALAERGDLGWTAFQRPDNADDGLLGAMRRADQSSARAFLPTGTFDRAEVERLKRRLNSRFYLRPGYL